MRPGVIAGGIFLLIIGILIYSNASIRVDEYQSFTGQVSRFFSEEARRQYEYAQAAMMVGGVLGLMGILITAYGFMAERKEDYKRKVNIPTLLDQRYCKFCGELIHQSTVFCPYCGRSQR